MLTQAHRELWTSACEELRAKLGEDRFARWIAPLKVLSEEGGEVSLGVANRFVQDWIEKCYASAIERALGVGAAEPVKLTLVIDPELYQEHRRACASVFEAPLGSTPCVPSTRAAPPWVSQSVSPSAALEPRADRVGARSPGGSGALDARPDSLLEGYVVGVSNQMAFNALVQVIDLPGVLYNPLYIHGAAGVGKTHLLKGAWARLRAGASGNSSMPGRPGGLPRVHYVTGEQLFHEFSSSVQDGTTRRFRERYRGLDTLLVDDVHLLGTKRKTQIELLQTLSALVDSGRQVVLAATVAPKDLEGLDPALVGRFLSGLVVNVRRPDFETRLGILKGFAARFSTRWDERVLEFLAGQVRGNARELLGALMKLDIHSQVQGGPLGVEDARVLLLEIIREQEARIDLARIRDVVAGHYGIAPETLSGTSRQRHIAFARQVAMFLARRHTSKPLVEIGAFFGKRNHSTVKCAEAKITRMLETPEGSFARELSVILERLED